MEAGRARHLTPPNKHTEYACSAARAGIHFFTEASVVRDGMEELLELVKDRSIVAAPSCTMRFHPAVRIIKERLERRGDRATLSRSLTTSGNTSPTGTRGRTIEPSTARAAIPVQPARSFRSSSTG